MSGCVLILRFKRVKSTTDKSFFFFFFIYKDNNYSLQASRGLLLFFNTNIVMQIRKFYFYKQVTKNHALNNSGHKLDFFFF